MVVVGLAVVHIDSSSEASTVSHLESELGVAHEAPPTHERVCEEGAEVVCRERDTCCARGDVGQHDALAEEDLEDVNGRARHLRLDRAATVHAMQWWGVQWWPRCGVQVGETVSGFRKGVM